MAKKGPWKYIDGPFPAVTVYLNTPYSERPKGSVKSRFNLKASEIADYCMRYLILFAQNQTEDRVAEALAPDKVVELVAALAGKGCESISERQYGIAIGMADVGVRRALKLIPDVSWTPGMSSEPRMKREMRELLGDLTTLLRPHEQVKIPTRNRNFELEREILENKNLRLEIARKTPRPKN